jgi:hypothetical protein
MHRFTIDVDRLARNLAAFCQPAGRAGVSIFGTPIAGTPIAAAPVLPAVDGYTHIQGGYDARDA